MPRLARKYLKGNNLFHVMVQGINRERIFNKKKEKSVYIKLVKKYKTQFDIDMISFCVMSNHVHLLIHTKDIHELTDFMHRINTSYGKYYNKTHKRVGYVYRDRFKVQVIRDEEHLYNCVLYIHNNPVKAQICKEPNEYEFSSYEFFFKINKLEVIKNLFHDRNAYERAHILKNINYSDFIEDEEAIEFNINTDIMEYLYEKKISKNDLKYNYNYSSDIISYLNEKYHLSGRKMSELTGINRKMIRKILE